MKKVPPQKQQAPSQKKLEAPKEEKLLIYFRTDYEEENEQQNEIDEENSDGSANAFERTEIVDD
jgi:hypothetical protein